MAAQQYTANLWKMRWQAFFAAFRIFVAIQYVYFQQNGLTFAQIGLVTGAFFAGMFIFEVPSGIFADHFGRKTSIIISSLLFVISFLLFGSGNSLIVFLTANFLQGAGESFVSGSDEAIIHDSLEAEGRESEFSKHFGGKWAYFMYGAGVSGLLTSLVSGFDLRLTFLLSVISAIVSLVFALTLKEPPLIKKQEQKDYLRHLKNSFQQLFSHKILKFLFVYIIAINLTIQIYFQYIQFMLKDIKVPIEYFGIVYALFIIFSGIASHTAHKIEHLFGKRYVLILITALPAIALLAPRVRLNAITIAISIIIVEFLFGFMWPVLNKYFHKYVESHNRATMSSARSFTTGLLVFCFAPLFGQIADMQGYTTMFLYLVVLMLIITVPAFIKFMKAEGGLERQAGQSDITFPD